MEFHSTFCKVINYKSNKISEREEILQIVKQDPTYSVFSRYKSLKSINFILPLIFEIFVVVITISISILLFILGPQFNFPKKLLCVIAAALIVPLTGFLIFYGKPWKKIRYFDQLMKTENTEQLLEFATAIDEAFIEYTDKFYAIVILIDLKHKKLASILKNELDKTDHSRLIQVLKWALNLLAVKFEYEDMFDLLNIPKEIPNKSESVIQISKVYFLEETPNIGNKCMVTSLPLDFDNERILVCPYCGRFALASALIKWLKIKAVCPACKRPLGLADCPEVLIRKKNGNNT
jgi:hypothetical protein